MFESIYVTGTGLFVYLIQINMLTESCVKQIIKQAMDALYIHEWCIELKTITDRWNG